MPGSFASRPAKRPTHAFEHLAFDAFQRQQTRVGHCLLNPAIVLAEEMGMVKWVPPLIGFLAGGFSMRLVDLRWASR